MVWDRADWAGTGTEITAIHSVRGINNLGQTTGALFAPDRYHHAAICDPSGQMIDLVSGSSSAGNEDFPNSITSSWAYDLNDHGQVVGTYLDRDMRHFGFLWHKATGMLDLGRLLRCRVYVATGINNCGAIIGCLYNSGGFFWSESSGLLAIAPGCNGRAYGINDANWVVGQLGPVERQQAFLWHQRVGLVDLNGLLPPDSGWTLLAATGINNLGEIIGWGGFREQEHNFVLTVREVRGIAVACLSEGNTQEKGVRQSTNPRGRSLPHAGGRLSGHLLGAGAPKEAGRRFRRCS